MKNVNFVFLSSEIFIFLSNKLSKNDLLNCFVATMTTMV